MLDFLNHFPILGVAAPNSSGKPQEVSLECVMSCNSDEILLSAQPSTGNKAPDQRKRRTLCDLPWTTNYFIGDVNKPPGQLSDKERTAIYKDQSAEFQKGYKAEKLGTEKIRSSTKGGDWRDEQEQLAALEFKYMDMLTAAQQTPRRRIEVEEVKVLGKKRHEVWLVLPEPDKLEGYSWIARKTIQSVSDVVCPAGLYNCDALLPHSIAISMHAELSERHRQLTSFGHHSLSGYMLISVHPTWGPLQLQCC